jgi:hypothetical protein
MVDSNVSLALESDEDEKSPLKSSNTEHISRSAAQENVSFLKTQADSWLAVLFNVFGAVERDDRGKIGDVITVWARIAKPEVRLVRKPSLRVYSPLCSTFRKHSPKWYSFSSKTSPSQLRPRSSRE